MAADLANTRVWLITGSSQGLGRHLTEAVLASGERVIATARKPSVLSDLETKYTQRQLLVLKLDVTVVSDVDNAFNVAKTHFGRLDVVVNNAGYGLNADIEATPDEAARKEVEVLFWAPVYITKKAVAFMRDTNPTGLGGRILQISSGGGFVGNNTIAFYSAGKFALEGFTEAFVKEVHPSWNIKMTIVEPGGFRTEWGGSSMVTLAPHPAYTAADSPNVMRRKMMAEHFKPQNDPAKGAQAMIKISKVENPPMRLVLGQEMLFFLRQELTSISAEFDKWEELSCSTLADDAEDQSAKIASVITRKVN